MRYVKVPVKFLHFPRNVWAQLECGCDGYDKGSVYGVGSTEDEAFADLLRELGYEEATATSEVSP